MVHIFSHEMWEIYEELQEEVPLKSKSEDFQKWVFQRHRKNSKIWRDFQDEGKNQVWKPREVIFQARNGVEKEKMQER